ncbi:hypothetical protein SAMN04489751_0397 [Brevibacterium sandarakinum]|uniref:Uncharacterized protein n=2 Tax=Brevibacterium TaxID=1696 RepID=A0A2A3ZMF5_BREAU|nr:hypothetical protein CIK59_13625 [Brevibacterium aurantiacum]SDR77109.1 hypothetical protein SAMN04489751_0397 [Brevibacterium sandarakinum]
MKSRISVAWVLVYIWLVFVLGLLVGTGIFSLVFLIRVAQMKIWKSIIYTACIVGALYSLTEFAQLVAPVGYLL